MMTLPSPLVSGSPAGIVPVLAAAEAEALAAGALEEEEADVEVSLLLAQPASEIPMAATAATPPNVRRLSRRLVTRGPFDLF